MVWVIAAIKQVDVTGEASYLPMVTLMRQFSVNVDLFARPKMF
jgi:hypothetical protein